MKTAELTGSKLDFWVAKALGERFDDVHELRECNGYYLVQPAITQDDNGEPFAPSELWAHGGPLIEREQIETMPTNDGWGARIGLEIHIEGPTLLIAAMRAYIGAKYGEEVPDEAAS